MSSGNQKTDPSSSRRSGLPRCGVTSTSIGSLVMLLNGLRTGPDATTSARCSTWAGHGPSPRKTVLPALEPCGLPAISGSVGSCPGRSHPRFHQPSASSRRGSWQKPKPRYSGYAAGWRGHSGRSYGDAPTYVALSAWKPPSCSSLRLNSCPCCESVRPFSLATRSVRPEPP